MPPIIDKSKCICCGKCALICNSQLFRFDASKKMPPEIAFPEECWHCDSCVLDCPTGAVSLQMPLSYMLLHTNTANLK